MKMSKSANAPNNTLVNPTSILGENFTGRVSPVNYTFTDTVKDTDDVKHIIIKQIPENQAFSPSGPFTSIKTDQLNLSTPKLFLEKSAATKKIVIVTSNVNNRTTAARVLESLSHDPWKLSKETGVSRNLDRPKTPIEVVRTSAPLTVVLPHQKQKEPRAGFGENTNVSAATSSTGHNDSLTNLGWVNRVTGDNVISSCGPGLPEFTGPPSTMQQANDRLQLDLHNTDSLVDIRRVATECGTRQRPPYSYLHLIQIAIGSSPAQKLTLREIYKWIEDMFPFYKHTNGEGWKNSVRHNLSLYDVFMRVQGQKGEQSSYWMLNKELLEREKNNGVPPWHCKAIKSKPKKPRNPRITKVVTPVETHSQRLLIPKPKTLPIQTVNPVSGLQISRAHFQGSQLSGTTLTGTPLSGTPLLSINNFQSAVPVNTSFNQTNEMKPILPKPNSDKSYTLMPISDPSILPAGLPVFYAPVNSYTTQGSHVQDNSFSPPGSKKSRLSHNLTKDIISLAWLNAGIENTPNRSHDPVTSTEPLISPDSGIESKASDTSHDRSKPLITKPRKYKKRAPRKSTHKKLRDESENIESFTEVFNNICAAAVKTNSSPNQDLLKTPPKSQNMATSTPNKGLMLTPNWCSPIANLTPLRNTSNLLESGGYNWTPFRITPVRTNGTKGTPGSARRKEAEKNMITDIFGITPLKNNELLNDSLNLHDTSFSHIFNGTSMPFETIDEGTPVDAFGNISFSTL
ncbi:unnamed protein product [Owenia fusiformis]|uniref:Uncharacterized protein n=1 Tax=Owenia fusiformis TaxID=6347 RepID=A0A8J1U392_OWEFU|nr:unnamed protein product [Owenia fusiformis]